MSITSISMQFTRPVSEIDQKNQLNQDENESTNTSDDHQR